METGEIMIIPGGGVEPVNAIESASTGIRCRRAAAVYQHSPNQISRIVVPGGTPHAPAVQTRSTADLAHDYLVQLGVPASKLLTVPEGRDSFEEIRATLQALAAANLSTTALRVVTFRQHFHRYRLTLEAYGAQATHVHSGEVLSREAVALEEILIYLTRKDPKGTRWYWRLNRWRRTYPRPPLTAWLRTTF